MEIPTLNQTVLDTLTFFAEHKPSPFNIRDYNLPFVVGSGNALSTGKIIFSNKAAIFADESSFRSEIDSYQRIIEKGLISQTVVISASGEKDSVWEVELAKEKGLKTTLLTCKTQSTAAKIADEVFPCRSISEPYTYNTSTYLGMILASTQEDPKQILDFIQELQIPKNLPKYEAYSFVLADTYINICPMVVVKRDELFGPHLMIRSFTFGHARHAKFVHPWSHELVISVGEENKYFGHQDNRWDITLPQFASFGTVMALCYYLCGVIQEAKYPYFKENVAAFCNDYGPKAYGREQKFEVIVPGTDSI